METLDIKFTKFDNRPWGFRLAGGYDFPEPLTVIRVSEESLAECMGLKVGDVIVSLNDQPIHELTHGQAHEALTLAGNNFVLGVRRAEDPNKLVEKIEDNVEPYMLPIENILFDPTEEKREGTPDEISEIKDESTSQQSQQPDQEQAPVEVYPEKPRDENSEKIANTNLTDEEIAQLIVEEEEVLTEKGVLGVNFKKLRPRLPLLKQSKVLREIQQELLEKPRQIHELSLQSTFLQKPERPVPKPRRTSQSEDQKSESEVEGYKVVIKKQPKRTVTERLLAKGLIEPSRIKTPEPSSTAQASEKTTPAATPEPTGRASDTESRPQSKAEIVEITEPSETPGEATKEETEEPTIQPRIEEPAEEEGANPAAEAAPQVTIRRPSAEVEVEVAVTMDRDKIKELVTTEISLERQLESVQSQLLALKQLPSEIEKHLKIVSDQLHKIMELSGVDPQQVDDPNAAQAKAGTEENQWQQEDQQQNLDDDDRHSTHSQDESSSWAPHLISTEDDTWCDSKELEISVKSNEDDGKKFKKYIVSYESKVESVTKESKDAEKSQTREPSPAVSHISDNFEVDPNLTLQDQLVQELKHRKGKKRGGRDLLWQPQAKQLELTYGRKWRCPNDFFNDDMIADALCSQAEVIRGRAMGVNFKKFEKKSLPNFDHLANSSVYKLIHKIEAEPKKGIPARPPIVVAAEDILERVNTPICCMAEDSRSIRSVSH